MKPRWILVAALVILAGVALLASRPFTATDNEPGQPSPHSFTQ